MRERSGTAVLSICEDNDKQDSALRERSGTGAVSVRSDSHVVHDHMATLSRVSEHNEQFHMTAATSVENNTEINNNHN